MGSCYMFLQFLFLISLQSFQPSLSLFASMQLFLPWLHSSKYFHLQIGSKQDLVLVESLKPALSDEPITHSLPPPRGRPPCFPIVLSSVENSRRHKRVRFHVSSQVPPPPVPYFIGIPTGLLEIEWSTRPFLLPSFCGEYCGGCLLWISRR